MPHLYNQRAFTDFDTANPLLNSYIRLVAIELALKNWNAANWGSGHQIDMMIASIGKPALLALAQKLQALLASLWCEKKGGGPTLVTSTNYPAIRYIRHVSDFGNSSASSENELEDLKNVIDDLFNELKREGILT
jgi:HPt (histidine-containing phosphotransfer) domain-containing protein